MLDGRCRPNQRKTDIVKPVLVVRRSRIHGSVFVTAELQTTAPAGTQERDRFLHQDGPTRAKDFTGRRETGRPGRRTPARDVASLKVAK